MARSETSDEAFIPGQNGWVSLTEGMSTRGWTEGEAAAWEAHEGALSGTNGKIVNRWALRDFEALLRFRGDGYLLFRLGSEQMGHIGFGQAGYRVRLIRGELQTSDGKVISNLDSNRSRDTWQILELRAVQGRLTAAIDGLQILNLSDESSPLKGRFGLAAETGVFQVDYLRVRSLNRAEEAEQSIPQDSYYCYVCHANFEYDEPLAQEHEAVEVGCAACHGPSLPHRQDEDNITPPDVFYRHSQVENLCLSCHESHEDRADLMTKELPMNRVCTDCHGEHRL